MQGVHTNGRRHLPATRFPNPSSYTAWKASWNVFKADQSGVLDVEHLLDCIFGGICQAGGEVDNTMATLLGIDLPR
jgi:hypothetical protein